MDGRLRRQVEQAVMKALKKTLRSIAFLAASLALAPGVASAQETKPEAKPEGKPEAPKPPAETDALSYFLGAWTFEGEMKPGPVGTGGPMKGREICRWMPGHFFVGCMMETQSPAGLSQIQGILGWDAEKKTYRWWSFDNLGRAETATATLKDGTWSWSGDSKMGDKTYKTRYTVSDTKPDGYAFSLESSADGKKWTPVMAGKATKAMMRPTPGMTPGGAKPPLAVTPAPAPTKTN